MRKRARTAVLFATWFGSGRIPPIILKGMAGTYGSLCSIPLCYLALTLAHPRVWFKANNQWVLYIITIIVVLIIGLLSIPAAERALGPQKDWRGQFKLRDQNQIVIDEVFGMLIACLPFIFVRMNQIHWWQIGIAFVLFRIFDVIKPPGVRYFDQQHDEVGVMLDDGVAGLYAAIGVTLVLLACN